MASHSAVQQGTNGSTGAVPHEARALAEKASRKAAKAAAVAEQAQSALQDE